METMKWPSFGVRQKIAGWTFSRTLPRTNSNAGPSGQPGQPGHNYSVVSRPCPSVTRTIWHAGTTGTYGTLSQTCPLSQQ
jgi:hypothetical protein